MKLLYIAAPYRSKTIIGLQQNISDARTMAMYYWNKNYAVICPHLNSVNFDGLLPDKTFLQGTLLMLSKCDVIAMHPNWEQSSGCRAEYNFMLHREDTTILQPDWEEVCTIFNKIYRIS